MVTRALGRTPRYDERSRAFSIAPAVADEPLRSRTWTCRITLDQGAEGSCVGQGFTHGAVADPIPWHDLTEADAVALYQRARVINGDAPGEVGTSVLAGAKAAVERGYLESYRWAFSVPDMLRTLSGFGPVVLGITWFENMYTPDARHYIHASGPVAGGHCILARGWRARWKDGATGHTYDDLDLDKSYVTLRNSWSESWGKGGDGFVSLRDMIFLMGREQNGECCVPVVKGHQAKAVAAVR